MNSENRKTTAYGKNRNPLADLCQNDHNSVNIRKVVKSVSTVKTVRTDSVKPRPNSASEVETKVKYLYKSENITKRQTENETVDNVDEVFVEGEGHFLNYLPENQQQACVQHKLKPQEVEPVIAQVLPAVRVTAATSERADGKKPAKKITLTRTLSNRSKHCRTQELYRNCLYDTTYFEDNYRYMLEREKEFVYRKHFLQKYSYEHYRMMVVNWLVYAQQVLDISEATFFVTIRMFDYLLISAKISCNKYILVGIVCMWIANKQLDVHFVQVPKLFALCNCKFSRLEILSMEQKILKLLEFNVNFPEPATFLYYYLNLEKLQSDSKIRNSAMFLLEGFTLLTDFSSMKPSLLASMALYLVLVRYDVQCGSLLEHVERSLLDLDLFKQKCEQLADSVRQLLKCDCVANEIIAKYSTADRHQVAQSFFSE